MGSAPLSRPIEWLSARRALDPVGDRVASLTAGRDGTPVRWLRGEPLGHPAHPALTDLPIGFWTSATLLDVLGGRRARPAARRLLGWGVASALPTLASGLVDVPRLPPDRRRVAVVHAVANSLATVGFAGSWVARRRGRYVLGVATGFAAGAAASAAGALGGWLALAEEDAPEPGSAEALAVRVSELLDGRNVATAESCTSGRIANALAAGGDAAGWFRGALVSYQEHVKRDQLRVEAASVYSEQAAVEMATGVCRLLGADAAVATTGVLGDEPQDGVPPGTVFIATVVDGASAVRTYRFDGSPAEACERATECALHDLAAALEHAASSPRP